MLVLERQAKFFSDSEAKLPGAHQLGFSPVSKGVGPEAPSIGQDIVLNLGIDKLAIVALHVYAQGQGGCVTIFTISLIFF